MNVMIYGKQANLKPSSIIGEGGEALIYDLRNGEVAKVFKQPNHSDFALDRHAQAQAKDRLKEHQKKLKKYPKDLPSSVVGPTSLITDVGGVTILGYTMPFLSSSEVLLKYEERKYRELAGVTHQNMVQVFLRLHEMVAALHVRNVVIGDFNDLNIMIDKALAPHLIDADSMQFGGFLTKVFTARFVDPLLCDRSASSAALVRPHTALSDWYAFNVMLMQALLYAGPYSGIHTPQDISKKYREWERVQKRVTVFSPDVRYPRPALHYSMLPDELLTQFSRVFEKDERIPFPSSLLSSLTFTECPLCKKIHARKVCPDCTPLTPSLVKEVVLGNVEATKVFSTHGTIVYAKLESGIPKYVYHENGTFFREGGKQLIEGKVDASLRFRIHKTGTLLTQDGSCVLLEDKQVSWRFMSDRFRAGATILDANDQGIFMIQGGVLKKVTETTFEYPKHIGSVVSSQSLLWVGDRFGFVTSFVSQLTRSYLFDTEHGVLEAEVKLDDIASCCIDATVVFSSTHMWFIGTYQKGKDRTHKVYMIDRTGVCLAKKEVEEVNLEWLMRIRGKCAYRDQLFVPTDDGVVRVESHNGDFQVTKVFPNTSRFVDSSSTLMFGRDGLYALTSNMLWRLVIK